MIFNFFLLYNFQNFNLIIRICRPCNKYKIFQTMMSLPNTGGKKNTFSPIRIEAEQMFHKLVDQSDIRYQAGNVRRGIPMTGKRSLKDMDIRIKCKDIVEEHFEPQLQLQCSKEWFKRNYNNRKATFKHRAALGGASLQGHQIIDREAQLGRQPR